MKPLLISLPLLVCAIGLGGCSAPSNESSDPKDFIQPNAAQTSDATTGDTTTGGTMSAKTGSTADTPASTQNAGDKPTYRVVDESNPTMTPAAVAALKKAQLPPPPISLKLADAPRLKISTTKGDITVQLNPKAAPLHAKSFVYLAGRKFFDGAQFHRYEPGFVIQGGDPLTKNPKLKEFFGQGGPGYQIPREYNSLKHDQYVLSAARSSDPDSAGSQFYITLEAANFLDQEQAQDGVGYTVFGKVVSGQNVVQKLRAGDKMKSVTRLK